MESSPFMQYAVVLLLAAVIAVPLAKRTRLGAVLGYLAAGALIGPSALNLIGNAEEIAHISELGVILMLFVIGLELSPQRLWVMRRQVFGFGSIQVLVSALAIGAVCAGFGLGWKVALVVGLGLALSSSFVLAQHTDKETQEDIKRHRAMAAAHEAAAKCLESGKKEDVCTKELQAACKGLAIGKTCGMKHAH